MDGTILTNAVAAQDAFNQLIPAIRRAAREGPGAAGQTARVCTGHDYSVPGEHDKHPVPGEPNPAGSWRRPQTMASRFRTPAIARSAAATRRRSP